MEKQKKIPLLRFPQYTVEWQLKKFGSLVNRISTPVNIDDEKLYKQIGIRSHGKGLFYKDAVTGKSLGNKRVFWIKEDTFVVNIVFAWEQAVARTTVKEIGMIASHRFPMYLPINTKSNLDYLVHFFLTKKGKFLLELASPGGAGRNKTLGQKEFENLKFHIPSSDEQTEIASFLTAIDNKLAQLKQKKSLLEKYKKGVMQKIFSQEIRFKDEDGKAYPKWEKIRLSNLTTIQKGEQLNVSELTETGSYPALNGGINASGYTNNWNTEANTISISEGGNSCGYVKFNNERFWSGGHCYTLLKIIPSINCQYLFQILKYNEVLIMRLRVGSGLPNIQKKDLNNYSLQIPIFAEQIKIANFLSAIDEKISYCQLQIEKTELYKKGLLQKMFV